METNDNIALLMKKRNPSQSDYGRRAASGLFTLHAPVFLLQPKDPHFRSWRTRGSRGSLRCPGNTAPGALHDIRGHLLRNEAFFRFCVERWPQVNAIPVSPSVEVPFGHASQRRPSPVLFIYRPASQKSQLPSLVFRYLPVGQRRHSKAPFGRSSTFHLRREGTNRRRPPSGSRSAPEGRRCSCSAEGRAPHRRPRSGLSHRREC